MSSLDVSSILAGLAVSDMDRSIAWYTTLLGRVPNARPMPPLADWNFPGGYTLQIFHDPDRAGGSMVTLHVAGIAAARDTLAERGIDLAVDDTTSDKVKFGQLTDPDGNSISLVEPKTHFDPDVSN